MPDTRQDGEMIMGDRISIQFEGEYEEKSIVIFEHWAGKNMISGVREWLKDIDKRVPYKKGVNGRGPIERREPCYAICDFIAWYSAKYPNNSMYLGATEFDGDNSDNGHYIYNFVTGLWNREDVP
jgi:hypothetical protein